MTRSSGDTDGGTDGHGDRGAAGTARYGDGTALIIGTTGDAALCGEAAYTTALLWDSHATTVALSPTDMETATAYVQAHWLLTEAVHSPYAMLLETEHPHSEEALSASATEALHPAHSLHAEVLCRTRRITDRHAVLVHEARTRRTAAQTATRENHPIITV